jgi:hypothetical protein
MAAEKTESPFLRVMLQFESDLISSDAGDWKLSATDDALYVYGSLEILPLKAHI